MAGSGTRDPEGVEQVRTMARLLGRRLGREVAPAFAYAASPSVEEAVASVRERQRSGELPGTRVVIASYVLAPGHFHDLVRAAGADAVSAPLGDHELVAEVALERYEASLGA